MKRGFSFKHPRAPRADKATTKRTLPEMTHSELEHLLDAEVSFWVRASAARDLDFAGFVPCYTCGSQHHWKKVDAGHYIGRSNRGVRWDLRNIRPQCTKCNSYEEGQHWKFRKNLVAELGEDEVQVLEREAEIYGSTKMPREWIIDQIQRWRVKNAPLRKEIKCLG